MEYMHGMYKYRYNACPSRPRISRLYLDSVPCHSPHPSAPRLDWRITEAFMYQAYVPQAADSLAIFSRALAVAHAQQEQVGAVEVVLGLEPLDGFGVVVDTVKVLNISFAALQLDGPLLPVLTRHMTHSLWDQYRRKALAFIADFRFRGCHLQ